MTTSLQRMRIFASGLDHPEGIAVGTDGAVYAGGEEGQIYRISPDGAHVEQIGSTKGFCLGLALGEDSRVFICDCKHDAMMTLSPDGRCELFANEAGGRRLHQPNFPVFDRAGNLYVSCSGDWEQPNAFLCRFDPAGRGTLFHPGPLHFANGMALAPDEQSIYVVESTIDRVIRIPITPEGAAGELETFVEDLAYVPDGLAFDAAGNLLVTCYASDTLYRVRTDGTKEILCVDRQALLLNRPTNCAFQGTQLLIANLGGNHLSAWDYGHEGHPLFRSRDLPTAFPTPLQDSSPERP